MCLEVTRYTCVFRSCSKSNMATRIDLQILGKDSGNACSNLDLRTLYSNAQLRCPQCCQEHQFAANCVPGIFDDAPLALEGEQGKESLGFSWWLE